jgi:hypothetical protein
LDHGSLAEPACRVNDLKYGKGVFVEAEHNPQLKLYALGIVDNYYWLVKPKTFILTIDQPRRDYVGEWEVTTDELIQWAWDVAKPAAETALKPGAPFKAGEWCRFCRIRETCKTRASWVFEQALDEFDTIDQAIDNASDVRPANELTDDQLARIWPALSGIRAWCGDIEKRIITQLNSHAAVGDLKLVRGRSSRKFIEGADEQLLQRVWMMDIHPYVLKSPAVLESELGKEGKPLIQDLIKISPGKPTIAASADKRPAMNLTAESEFENELD